MSKKLCPFCAGEKTRPTYGFQQESCPRCEGTGIVSGDPRIAHDTYCPTCCAPASLRTDHEGAARYRLREPYEEIAELRQALSGLVDAVEGQTGDDTVSEALEYMGAMQRAKDLVARPERVIRSENTDNG